MPAGPGEIQGSAVLDASAILALIYAEPGAELVEQLVRTAVIGAVNLAEAASVLIEGGMTEDDARSVVAALPLTVLPFDRDMALETAALRPRTRAAGLSLGDRACLALGIRLVLPVLTADRAWEALDVGVPVRLIR